jgi:hypothetical protein
MLHEEQLSMKPMTQQVIPSMKRFVIREAETLKTTKPSYYGACCCRFC